MKNSRKLSLLAQQSATNVIRENVPGIGSVESYSLGGKVVAALAQHAQPLTDEMIEHQARVYPGDLQGIIGRQNAEFDFAAGAKWARDRMAQQAQRTDDYACRHNVKARECKICSPENKF